jgi:hypothetical protein
MRTLATSLLAFLCVGIPGVLGGAGAEAQTMALTGVATIAMKSGETTEVGNLYYVANCRSLLTSRPEVEILDGPPGVAASIKEDLVLPRAQKCPSPVKGGKLFLEAKDIENMSFSTLTLRITYKTRDGDRKLSHMFNLSLFP